MLAALDAEVGLSYAVGFLIYSDQLDHARHVAQAELSVSPKNKTAAKLLKSMSTKPGLATLRATFGKVFKDTTKMSGVATALEGP